MTHPFSEDPRRPSVLISGVESDTDDEFEDAFALDGLRPMVSNLQAVLEAATISDLQAALEAASLAERATELQNFALLSETTRHTDIDNVIEGAARKAASRAA
ncbi:hypothetical protein IV203_036678 [Nitzschia inconspicua]|uniref:Uncharacterized protein n=1 Tax=Nitzschia inconspicua TaxID=303405 RepID=A0A9K3LGC5_9STRA|nr:hypothetical protein IV203_036678 [Nitzschia inconspicua]